MPKEGIGCGVVDENIQLAVSLADMGKDRLDLCHFADMAGEGFRTATVCLDRVCHRLTAIDLAAGDDHVGALLRQQSGNLFTNPAAGAGDQGNLALKIKKGGTHYYSPDKKQK